MMAAFPSVILVSVPTSLWGWGSLTGKQRSRFLEVQ